MKIYTQTYDIAQPTEQRFWTPPFSDFKIGLKVTNKGEEVQGALSLKAGDAALSAEASEIDGFTIFPTSSAGAGSTVYTLSVEGVPETLKLVQVTTGSTVFEIDEAGGDMSNYYTKSETSSATELGNAFNGKVTDLSAVSGIMKISQADYSALSSGGTADDSTLYVIV